MPEDHPEHAGLPELDAEARQRIIDRLSEMSMQELEEAGVTKWPGFWKAVKGFTITLDDEVGAALDLVDPSAIRWEDFTGSTLEEALFVLCGAMGATDLVWRTGRHGRPVPDGGRDIECVLYTAAPEGDMTPERWWIQAKGRKRGGVEPAVVKEAVVNAAAYQEVDVLVIATNVTFTNATRDWVREWMRAHPRPDVRLWDHRSLERMLTQHADVVAAVAPEALLPTGNLDRLRARFFQSLRMPRSAELAHLWSHRDELHPSPLSLVALTAAELGIGDPVARPWIPWWIEGLRMHQLEREPNEDSPSETALRAIASLPIGIGLNNIPHLMYRALTVGVSEEIVFNLAGYLMSCGLLYLDTATATKLFTDPFAMMPSKERLLEEDGGRQWEEVVFRPVMENVRHALGVACARDCQRIVALPRDRSHDPFRRLSTAGLYRNEEAILWIEAPNDPCAVGLEVGDTLGCPWLSERGPEVDVPRMQIALKERVSRSDALVRQTQEGSKSHRKSDRVKSLTRRGADALRRVGRTRSNR